MADVLQVLSDLRVCATEGNGCEGCSRRHNRARCNALEGDAADVIEKLLDNLADIDVGNKWISADKRKPPVYLETAETDEGFETYLISDYVIGKTADGKKHFVRYIKEADVFAEDGGLQPEIVEWFGTPEEGEKVTNSEYIRSMTEKELARFIGGISDCCGCPIGVCPDSAHCVENMVKFLSSEADPERYECLYMPDPEVGA